jgi:hypothetical protein
LKKQSAVSQNLFTAKDAKDAKGRKTGKRLTTDKDERIEEVYRGSTRISADWEGAYH